MRYVTLNRFFGQTSSSPLLGHSSSCSNKCTLSFCKCLILACGGGGGAGDPDTTTTL